MVEKEKWHTKLIGKLNNESHMIFAKDGSAIRYPIKVLSNPPEDLPDVGVNYLTSFSSDLENLGYIDDTNLSNDDRINYLQEFLDAHYLIFKIKSKQNEGDRTFYNAYDIEIIRRETQEDVKFSGIPFIRTYGENTEEILKKLSNNEYLGANFAISKESMDYPSFILIGEYTHKNEEKLYATGNLEKLIAFGPIEGMQYSEEFGYKFIAGKDKKFYMDIKYSDLGESYLSKEKVMFITWDKELEIRTSLEKRGIKLDSSEEKLKIEDISETEFLKTFQEIALSKGLAYKPSNINNFHTAFKTQSFVILAGMSGIGKSKIVQCYHEALNVFAIKPFKNNKSVQKSKLLFVPVRPFWQDDSDLLGYLDSTQGIYRPGDSGLVDFIKEANDNPDECYIVCLDEMNLAKVEHYFSQFLSILERDVKDRYLYLYNEKLSGRIYNHNDYKAKLKLSENLFFVGTVNIDESTHQFSDKVLDRANLITLELCSFKEIREQVKLNQTKEKNTNDEDVNSEPLRTYVKLKSMKTKPNKDVLTSKEIELLWKINLKMQNVNNQIGVGYRIVEQIENYIANLPNSPDLLRTEAFDLQITQRVFTKLRGSQGQLGSLIGTFENNIYKEGKLYELLDEYTELSDFDIAKQKLVHLAKELDEYGHTI